MEIIVLVLLYYLSQNPDFTESVKPLMNQLKNSQQMLSFLGDLSSFTQTFSTFRQDKDKDKDKEKDKESQKAKPTEEKESSKDAKKDPQSPTAGIADDFIEKILKSYLQKR